MSVSLGSRETVRDTSTSGMVGTAGPVRKAHQARLVPSTSPQHPAVWLYSIALKKCLEVRRNSARRDALTSDHQRLIAQRVHCDPPAQPEEICRQARQRQLVWQALRRLRRQERELVILRFLEDLTYDEMAQILKVSKRTVERRLPLAQAKFHQVYEKCQNKAMAHTISICPVYD